MSTVQVSPELDHRPWHRQWQRVALWYRARDYAAVMDAVCTVKSRHLIIEDDDWMIKVQVVSPKQATLVKMFMPHPDDMTFCDQSGQITVFPIRDLRGTARCLRDVVPQARRVLMGRLILDLRDLTTFGGLCLALDDVLDILPQRRYPVLLDTA